jgi:hypothetical protein
VLNGTSLETSSPGRFTSWQTAGESVIDYAIISASLLPMIREFHVEEPMEDEDDEWADHMRICITLDVEAFEQTAVVPEECRERPNFGGTEYIDRLYQATMDAKETKDEALDSLWGPTMSETVPVHIYIEGVRPRDRKGAHLVLQFSTALSLHSTSPYEFLAPND